MPKLNIPTDKNYNGAPYPINITNIYLSFPSESGRILAEYDGVENVDHQPNVVRGTIPAGGRDRHQIEGGITGGTGNINMTELVEEFEVDIFGKELDENGLVIGGTNSISKECALSYTTVYNDGSESFHGFTSVKLSKPQRSQTGTNVNDVAASYITVPFTYKPDEYGVAEVSKDNITDEQKIAFIKRVHGKDIAIEGE